MKEQEYIRLMVKNIMNRGAEVGIEDAIAEAVTYLNTTINGLQEALREQTAKVQDRDERIERLKEINQGIVGEKHELVFEHLRELGDRDAEIERLRAALQHEYDEHVGHGYVTAARRVAAALKGAE